MKKALWHVLFATLFGESKAIQAQLEREKREQERAARERHLQDIYNHRDTFWRQVDMGAARKSASGYDEVVKLLVDLRDAADQFNDTQEFQARFSAWIRPYLGRPSLVKRLQDHNFMLPKA